MTPEPTDAEWLTRYIAFLDNCHAMQDRTIPSPETIVRLRSIAAKLERPAVKARIWEDPSLGWYVEARPCTADVKAALGSLPGNDGWCTVTISPA